jgi:hypothetical protein
MHIVTIKSREGIAGGKAYRRGKERRKHPMDTTTIVRIVAGILAVAVLAFVIYRRKHAKA